MTAPIRSQAELLDAIRARRDELNISHETIDNIAGFQAGYCSKLLAPKPVKNLGPMSLGAMLGALGIALVAVPDPAATEQVEGRWQPRKRPQKLPPQADAASTTAEIQITPEMQRKLRMSELGKLGAKAGASNGGKRRAKVLGKRARQRIATHAARMRWAKRHD